MNKGKIENCRLGMNNTGFILLDSVATVKDIHDYVRIYGSLVVSVLTFILGYVVANRINKKKEKKELNNLKEMFFEYEASFIKSTEQLIKNLVDFQGKIKNAGPYVIPAYTSVAIDYGFFNSFNKEKLYQSLIADSVGLTYNLSYYFSKFHCFVLQNDNELKLFYKKIESDVKELRLSFESRRDILDDLIVKYHNSAIIGQIELLSIIEIRRQFYEPLNKNKDKALNPNELLEKCINPIFDILKDTYKSKKHPEIAVDMKELNSVRRLIKGYSYIMDDSIKQISTALEVLQRQCKNYKENRDKITTK